MKQILSKSRKYIKEEHGAVIIEAAISLPIFMFLIFSILFTINMSIVQCRMQIALNETAKEISQYSYFYSLTGLNNLSAINADAAADTKQQVSDVVSGITTVYGSFENMVTDVADAKDDISQKIEDIDIEGIENTVDTLKEQVSSEANTMSDGAKQTINTLKAAFKDPKALMLGLARIGANELDETVKSHLVAMMTQTLIKKNLADISNADDAYIDAYLRHLGVVGGFEGIDFTKSLYFKDGSDDIILIADYKVRLIRLFEHDIEFHFVQSAVTKAWMAGGLAESETTGTTLVTGDKLSDLTGEELRAKIVDAYGEDAVEKLEEEYPDDTSNWSYDDWMYLMYFSGETESNNESETQTELETKTETTTIVDSDNSTETPTKQSTGVGSPVPIEGRGNTGRTIPNTLNEQIAMHQVQSNPLEGATKVPLEMNDPRWPASEGWVKMQSVVQNADGTKTTIHYVYNEITGVFDDFKFKDKE